jgi:hypothetical protein
VALRGKRRYTTDVTQLLNHVIIEAHDLTTGEITSSGLRKAFALKPAEIAGIAGVTPRAIRNDTTSPKTRLRFDRFLKTMLRLRRLLDGDTALVRIWLRSPHPDLNDRTPASYLRDGQLEVVEMLVSDAESGQTA